MTPHSVPGSAGFLEAIVAAPEDDVPRMIYADWLEERGEGRLASVVRQKRLRGRDLRHHRWRRYVREMLEGIVPKSWRGCPVMHPEERGEGEAGLGVGGEDRASWAYMRSWTFPIIEPHRPLEVCLRYGFVSEVATSLNRLLKVLPGLVRSQPVREVAVGGLFLNSSVQFVFRVGRDEKTRFQTPHILIARVGDRIPDDIFALLTPPTWITGGYDACKGYPSRTAAYQDLSRALLTLARRREG